MALSRSLRLAPLALAFACGMPPIPAPITPDEPEGEDAPMHVDEPSETAEPGGPEPTPEPEPEPELPPPAFAAHLALGAAHSCVLLAPEALWCWGADHHRQLQGDALGRQGRHSSPRSLSLPGPLRVLRSGSHHLCAIDDGGFVWCWGNNSHGQAVPEEAGSDAAAPTNLGFRAVDLALGEAHSCALLPSGHLRCWGRNLFGEHGRIDPDQRFDAIAARGSFTCAREGHTAQWSCWGANVDGQLGNAPSGPGFSVEPQVLRLQSTTPTEAPGVPNTTEGAPTDAAERSENAAPQGAAETPTPAEAAPANAEGTFQSRLALGWGHGCHLQQNTLQCWGRNDSFQSGRRPGGAAESRTVPNVLPLPEGVLPETLTVALGARHTCLGSAAGTFCRGLNHRGQLGDRSSRMRRSWRPAAYPRRSPTPLQVAAGVQHTCSLHEENVVYCWGDNREGQLGLGHRRPQNRPRAVPGLAVQPAPKAGSD